MLGEAMANHGGAGAVCLAPCSLTGRETEAQKGQAICVSVCS